MKRRSIVVLSVIALVTATATTAMTRAFQPLMPRFLPDSLRPGPDSARVARLLSSLGAGDALVCEMLADQLGNFWWNGNDDGVGRFGDATNTLASAKDSLHGRISQPGAITLLANTLNTDNACVRRVAAKLLGRSRVDNARLTGLLTDASSRTREAAAYAIGSGEHRNARAALERMLRDREAPEAAMAAWALGELEDSASLPALERAVTATDVRVRLAAVQALGRIEDASALGTLEQALRRDASEAVRAHAAHAIGDIGQSRSLTPLAAAIADVSPRVRYAAVEALENLDDVRTAPPQLMQAAQSSDMHLRKLALMTLAGWHDPASIETLLANIGSPDREVRVKIAEALGEIGSPKASAGLLRLIKDADAEVRRAAAEALGEISR